MKVNDTAAPATDPSLDPSTDADSSTDDTQTQGEPSAFSRVLAKKQDAQQEGANAKGPRHGEREVDASNINVIATPANFSQVSPAQEVTAKHVVEIPPQLQQLVREISVVAGRDQVHIELNSNVLKGLHIEIEKQNGGIAIQFQSSSPEVTKLLTSNMTVLSQSLADRGLSVSDIRVTDPKEASDVPAPKGHTAAGESRHQAGRQSGRR